MLPTFSRKPSRRLVSGRSRLPSVATRSRLRSRSLRRPAAQRLAFEVDHVAGHGDAGHDRAARQAERRAVEHDLRVARSVGRFRPVLGRQREQAPADRRERIERRVAGQKPRLDRRRIGVGVGPRDGARDVVIGGEGPAPGLDVAVERQPAMAGPPSRLPEQGAGGVGIAEQGDVVREGRIGIGVGQRQGQRGQAEPALARIGLDAGVEGRRDVAEDLAVERAVELHRFGLRQQGPVAAEIGDIGPVGAGNEIGERRRAGGGGAGHGGDGDRRAGGGAQRRIDLRARDEGRGPDIADEVEGGGRRRLDQVALAFEQRIRALIAGVDVPAALAADPEDRAVDLLGGSGRPRSRSHRRPGR